MIFEVSAILNSLAVSLTPPQAVEFLNVLPSIKAKLPEEIRIRRSVLPGDSL